MQRIRYSFECVSQVFKGINAIHFARFNDGVDNGSTFAAFITACKEVIFSAAYSNDVDQ